MAVTESIFYLGKPYEGKPHVRFDEGSRKTGFNICTASLSYSTIIITLLGVLSKSIFK